MSAASEFVIRTEDLKPEEILKVFVPTARDLELVASLKSATPLIIEGSRGTGKSLLLRVCEQQQVVEFESARVLPVYVSFAKSSLLNAPNSQQFQHWMLARLCSRILRVLGQQGLVLRETSILRVLSGGDGSVTSEPTKLEKVAEQFEESYRKPKLEVDDSAVPTVEDFRDAIQDLCESLGIKRLNILFDEAAHIFRPEQQRQFFTLFRDLRSPYMTCNAAVYPGVTAYGAVFETMHDARIEPLNRDVLDSNYRSHMRDIVFRQASSEVQRDIATNGQNFDALAYAVSGNPRLLLKAVAMAPKLRSSEVQSVIKELFRTIIWSEHSSLAGRYPGHKELIDWGRNFVEGTAIPDLQHRNDAWQKEDRPEKSNILWLHRDAPEAVREAFRLLTYTGILSKMDDGVVATRRQIGSRYSVNIGCLVAPQANSITATTELVRGLTVKRFIEYGANQPQFVEIAEKVGGGIEADVSIGLSQLLKEPISTLDISSHQKSALDSIGIKTIADALNSDEAAFQKAYYVGPVRSRRIMNIVIAAVLEYLSG